MDLETENRIAAILLKEAAELRRQAEKDGVHAYFRQPNIRARPNSRFLAATVLSVEQANRAVEVNEMWQARERERELNDRYRSSRKDDASRDGSDRVRESRRGTSEGPENIETKAGSSSTPNKREREDEGLGDDELEEFLHSRVKRGRGAVGSRIDETGPYLPGSNDEFASGDAKFRDEWENRIVLGPEKPRGLKWWRSSSKEDSLGEREKVSKKKRSSSSHRSCSSSEEDSPGEREKVSKRKRSSTSHRPCSSSEEDSPGEWEKVSKRKRSSTLHRSYSSSEEDSLGEKEKLSKKERSSTSHRKKHCSKHKSKDKKEKKRKEKKHKRHKSE